MKKALTFSLIAAMLLPVLVLGGCGGNGEVTTGTPATDAPATEAPVITTEAVTEAPAPEPVRTLTVDNMAEWVKFNGRTYVNKAEKSVHFDWSLSGFEISFVGTGIKAELVSSLGSAADKNTMVYVFIDGVEDTSKPIWLNKKSEVITLCENLPEGPHTLQLLKRNCVSKASAGVKKIEVLGSDKATFTEKPADRDILIEFIGDSITSGDGTLTPDGKKDWISICQDATCSYAYYIARAFNADVSLVSRCGAGVIWNSSGKDASNGGTPMPSVYDYACKYYDTALTKWDFANERQPDLIYVNLGTNDKKQVYPSDTADAANKTRWMNEYEAFIRHIREVHPDVPIVCTIGMMIDAKYDLGTKAVVDKLTAEGMTGIYFEQVTKQTSVGVGSHPTARAQEVCANHFFIPFIQNIFPNWTIK